MNDHSEERQSKSFRKRQMLALQKMGEILVALPEAQLKKIPLDDVLLQAIHAARGIKDHEGKRRQLQYIGKLMRHTDPEPIEAALEKIEGKHQQSKAQFHQIERWRDRLIKEGDVALQECMKQYPDIDSQYVRQLVRKAQHDIAKNKNTGGETELFRYLRGIIEK